MAPNPVRLLCVLLVALAGFGQAAAARDFTARVVGVQDGDTVTVYAPGQPQRRVRLVEIDAPESGQPYGQRAKQVLSAMVFGRSVRVVEQGQDRYGRTLGRIYAGSTDVNAELVRRGAAWVYRGYSTDRSLPPLEARARRRREGLWGLQPDQITPPWEWRRAERSGSAAQVAAPSSLSAGSCPNRKRCSVMKSCAEARAELRRCGPDYLDGDRDGVPCEAICRP